MDSIISLFNFFPNMKTKAAAVAALALAVVAAWNAAVPDLGYGPCTWTPEELASGMKCAADLTVRVPEMLNALVLALLGVGAANQPKNAGVKP
jgi:hypothetical protein